MQEDMLRQYLVTAQEDLQVHLAKNCQQLVGITDQNHEQAKKELVTVKEQRLSLAQDEWNHLNSTLSHLSNSTTSCKSDHSLPFPKSMFLSLSP